MTIRAASTPIDLGLTFLEAAYTDLGTRYRPFGQALDLTLLGWDNTAKTIVRSTDDGATWTAYCPFVFPSQISQLDHLPDGEVLVATDYITGQPARLWRSTGWANPATATFTQVLALPDALFWSYGSISVRGNVVLCSEYGPQTSAGGNTARRAYLSTDGGLTFTQVFDLSTDTVAGEAAPWGGPSRQQHLHGSAVDDYWGQLWLAVGDASGATGVHAIIYRNLEGGPWRAIPGSVNDSPAHWQCVLPYATEHAMLFGSDYDATGLRRVGRAGYRVPGSFGSAHVLDHGAGIRLIGRHAYQAPGLPDAPVLFSFSSVGASYPGGVAAVTDRGRRYQTLYIDPATVAPTGNYNGVFRCLGPTNTGKFVVLENSTARFPSGSRMVAEIAPAAPYAIP